VAIPPRRWARKKQRILSGIRQIVEAEDSPQLRHGPMVVGPQTDRQRAPRRATRKVIALDDGPTECGRSALITRRVVRAGQSALEPTPRALAVLACGASSANCAVDPVVNLVATGSHRLYSS
jgi:hypothetical protein